MKKPLRQALACAVILVAATQALAQAGAARLNGYRAEAHSAAVSIGVGDRFTGPGPVTVGWLGAKKQILIPNGEWVLIGAVDHDSRHRPPAPLTSLAFAQFDERGVASLLVAVFTRRPGHPQHTWSDFARCEADAPGRLWQDVPSRFPVGHCMVVEPIRGDRLSQQMPEVLWMSIAENLPRLGIDEPGFDFHMRSTLYAVDNRGSYEMVRRYDRASGGAQEARVAWARQYLPLAAQGFRREIEAAELQPAGSAAARPLKLPD